MNDQKLHKVLVLGSGALKIGEAGEFDYSGSQALKALKSENIFTILVNPNIATIQTSKQLADSLYFVPVEPSFVEKVIVREQPEGILLSVGGQTALNCGLLLDEQRVFDHYGVRVLGTPIEAIKKTEDRNLFKQELAKLNLKYPKSRAVTRLGEAKEASREIGFPLILRVGYALGGLGSTLVRNKKEFDDYAQKALASSRQVLVEEYLSGWKEIEYEVVRDKDDNCITVCNMENFDPMGIHTGESIVVAPSQTLTNKEYQFLRNTAITVIRSLGIIGECNIQFALHPKKFDYRIIEVNARLSRSSALASKATGYPLAYIATKLALGTRLDELDNAVTTVTKAFFEPALDYMVVKMPRWDLDKFQNAAKTIGSEMKSVGEVMAIGRSFEEAIQKAARMLDQGYDGVVLPEYMSLAKTKVLQGLREPSPQRLFFLAAALYHEVSIDYLQRQTGIDPWFLYRLREIAAAYKQLNSDKLTPTNLRQGKQLGFSDKQIGEITSLTEDKVRAFRKQEQIMPVVKHIDTLAGEFPAKTNYLYLTYHGLEDEKTTEKENGNQETILVLGSGPYRIGSSVEFDWCAVNAIQNLRSRGYKTLMVNCNPETVSTDYDYSDALYFEELTSEKIHDIIDKERPRKLLLSVGGQIPNNLAKFCLDHGFELLGTHAESILRAENRHIFSQMLEKLMISQPPWEEFTSISDVITFAKSVGYPILARPSFVLSGQAMNVLYSNHDVRGYLDRKGRKHLQGKVVVSKFIEGAREIDYDAVSSEGRIIVRAISEHVERAGVHSGDSTLVLPPYRIGNDVFVELDKIAAKIAHELHIHGPFNIQFLERDSNIMVIECNLRCSRSFPFVSKVTGVNFMDVAIGVMLGEIHEPVIMNGFDYVGVKAPQFSFSRIRGADPVLRVEMASTGEVAAVGSSLYDAFLKSYIAKGMKIPKKNIFLSIGGWENKEQFFPYAKMLLEQGFSLFATDKTAKFLDSRGISCRRVAKLYEGGQPTAVDLLRDKKIDMVINITEPPSRGEETQSFEKRFTDGYLIRRTAIDFGVPLIGNLDVAMLFVSAIRQTRLSDLEVLPIDAYYQDQFRSLPKGGNVLEPIHGVWSNKHIISVEQFSKRDLEELLTLATKLKKELQAGKVHKDLSGKIMAAIFYEPSSRTFGSFITAMQRLGGGVIPLQGVAYSSVAKGELLPDTIQTFASYADLIVLRHPEVGSAATAAKFSPVPVINAGDGIGEHPTQALLDLMTIQEHFSSLDHLTIGMVGDLLNGRTIHSLARLLRHFKDITVYFVAPELLQLKPELEITLRKGGLNISKTNSLSKIIEDVDVLYMTRVQKERFADLSVYEKVKNYYILTPELMRKAKKDMIVMHPFPRVGEISFDVDRDPRAVYLRNQMQNGLYARMALLLLILGKT